jgi:general secretion pathway protein H
MRRSGFTLIELLIVIVIIAVMVATLVLSSGGSGARELENAAQRSRSLIALACERAVLGGRDIGFAPTRAGLRFGYFLPEGWHALGAEGSDELRARPWGQGVEAAVERAGEALELPDEVPAEADFACFASGELTPFRIDLSRSDVAQSWRLEGRLDGKLDLTLVDADAR